MTCGDKMLLVSVIGRMCCCFCIMCQDVVSECYRANVLLFLHYVSGCCFCIMCQDVVSECCPANVCA